MLAFAVGFAVVTLLAVGWAPVARAQSGPPPAPLPAPLPTPPPDSLSESRPAPLTAPTPLTPPTPPQPTAQPTSRPQPQAGAQSGMQSGTRSDARTLFREGLAAYRRGEFDVADEKLRGSLAASPRAATHCLLGQVQLEAGRTTDAAASFKRFLRHPDAQRKPQRVERARQALRTLRATHAWVKIHPWLRPLSLTIDGQVPQRGVLLLSAGSHRFQIQPREGGPPWSRDLDLQPGRYLLDVDPHSPQAEPRPRLRRARQRAAGADDGSKPGACANTPMCIGPWATLGVSHFFGVGGQLRRGSLGVALDVQASPPLGLGTVDVQPTQVAGSVRYHPLGYPFFAGVGLAYQYLRGGGTRKGERVEADAEVTSLMFVAGFSGGEGWVVGADFALMVDLHEPYVRLRLPADSSYFDDEALDAELESEIVQRVRDDLLSLRNFFPVPFQLNLIRVGYMF